MGTEHTILFLALLFGFYAAWNIGANDVANAMGTSVGSKALTLRQAVILASIFEFLGAVFFGSNVSETLEKGLITQHMFADEPLVLIKGMLASLLATGLWLQFASYCGLPVSTTHSIVGAIVGFGAIVGGVDAVQWDTVFSIAGSWVASPFLGAVGSYLIFMLMRYHIFYSPNPFETTKRYLPYIAAAVASVLCMTMMYRVFLPEAHFTIKLAITAFFALLAAVGALDTCCLYYGLSTLGKNLEILENYQPKIVENSKGINN